MALTFVNQDDIPSDLEPGTYCCHLDEGSAPWDMKVRMVLPPQRHVPGEPCCLIQLTKDTAVSGYPHPGREVRRQMDQMEASGR